METPAQPCTTRALCYNDHNAPSFTCTLALQFPHTRCSGVQSIICSTRETARTTTDVRRRVTVLRTPKRHAIKSREGVRERKEAWVDRNGGVGRFIDVTRGMGVGEEELWGKVGEWVKVLV